MFFTRSLATGVLALALVAPLPAQDWRGTQGRMEGKVVDGSGQPIAGATLKLDLPGRGGTSLKTDKKGKWAIGGIAAGSWNLDVSAEGFTTKQVSVNLPSEFARLAPVEIILDKKVEQGPPPEIMGALKDADAAFDAGKFTDARVLYEKALAEPKVAAQPAAAKALHFRIARALSHEEKYEEELAHLQAVLDADPTDTQVITLMAQEAIKGGMLEKGTALLGKLEDSQIKDPNVFFNVGVLFLNQQKQEEAIKYFTRSVTVDPSFVDGYVQRGLAYLGQQKMAECKADFQKVLSLAPAGSPPAEMAKKVLDSVK